MGQESAQAGRGWNNTVEQHMTSPPPSSASGPMQKAAHAETTNRNAAQGLWRGSTQIRRHLSEYNLSSFSNSISE
jgi:hypothetical protein